MEMKKTIALAVLAHFFLQLTAQNVDVKWAGALRDIMHKGDASRKKSLMKLGEKPDNLYALGAVEGLKGEILIWNGKPFIGYVAADSTAKMDTTFARNATLLVYAVVEKWRQFEVPDSVATYQELDAFIGQLAVKNGFNPQEKPFPFLMKGKMATLDGHIINWREGDTEHSHQKHIESGWHQQLTDADVDILGFYSTEHHTIWTHHSTNMHLHFLTNDHQISGHLDDVTLNKKVKYYIWLPK
jgi:acetolactate decarboxylase